MHAVSLMSLWLPILLSAVAVFIASSIIHMALGYHRTDFAKIAGEDEVLAAMREARVSPGNYVFPHASSMKEMGSEEMTAKYTAGPVGFVNVIPSGPINMGKALAIWFVYCLVLSFFVAYLASRILAPETDYLVVFRVVGTVAFLAFAGGAAQESIWKGQKWSTSLKNVFDGLVYGLVTAGVFGWLWP